MLRPAVILVLAAGCGESSPMLTDAPGLTSSDTPTQGLGAGELTAGAWDDNLNFDWFTGYLDQNAGLSGAPDLAAEERDTAFQRYGAARDPNVDLDVVLLLDTTGSMADELDYLTAEIGSIAAEIEDSAPDADVRWGLVAYRDHGDDYVTRPTELTGDLEAFRASLADQRAADGGDWPEASPEGLQAAVGLRWRGEPDVARLVFWVTDAPHHEEDAARMADAIRAAAALDVHLYPVAASGVDELAELTMRSAAQLTGGRYLFLTDDSGLGNEHKEPSVPCYFVTTLRDAMVRMVEIERTGLYVEPDPEDVIRTGGDPTDGRCRLDDGSEVIAF